MLIRAATAADSNQIAALHAASWRLAYRGALSDKFLAGDVESDRLQLWSSRLAKPLERQIVLVAEEAGHMQGFACAYIDEDTKWGSFLNNIHVSQGSQGRGVGKLILNAVALACGEPGTEGLYLWVLQSNTKAQGFYSRYGAQNTGTNIWEAPGGTIAPLFRFSWGSVAELREATADPLINRRWLPQAGY